MVTYVERMINGLGFISASFSRLAGRSRDCIHDVYIFITTISAVCPLPLIINGGYHVASSSGGDGDGAAYDAYGYDYGNPETTTVSNTHGSEARTELPIHGSIEVMCDSGYGMKGSKNVTCQSDGTLSGIPICVSISGE
jgi:hypothetical protein